MGIIDKAVQWAIDTASDNSHGYSQVDRWGPSDYDCSSYVITAYRQAGLKLTGASYTGNMKSAFLADGFFDATSLVNLGSGGGIQKGDVLLCASHTCIAIGAGRVANCRTDEGNPQAGDQSGSEIRLQGYWNYPWTTVLRYKGEEKESSTATATLPVTEVKEEHGWKPGTLKRSAKYNVSNVVLQALLTARGFNCGQIDGYFGPLTEIGVNHAKRYYGLERNGECDYALWIKLLLIER